MSVEQQLREQFDHATEHLGSADLDAVLDHGRRHRRRRIGTIAVGSVAAAAAVALAVTPLVHDRVAAKPLQPASHSKHVVKQVVSTNPVAKRLQAAVAAAAPELPAPSKLYPSDWNRNTPLPESQAANATEWQLTYTLPKGDSLLVYSSRPIPGYPADTSCPPKPPAGAPTDDQSACRSTRVSGGHLLDQTSGVLDQAGKQRNTTFLAMFVATDGRAVSVIDTVSVVGSDAKNHRSLTDAQLAKIATADDLQVPAPAVTPAPPTGP